MNNESTHEFMVSMGERLKSVRQLKGITQKQAAKDTGMSQSFLSSIERGQKSACTAQIIQLIQYYKIPYEMIFGDLDENYSMNGFPSQKSSLMSQKDFSYELLEMMIGKSNSKELINGTDNCMKICAYVIFRTVYRLNPRNSDKLFSISYEQTLEAAKRILLKAPESLTEFIRRSRGINPARFELPPEYNSNMRAFIKECEFMLSNG